MADTDFVTMALPRIFFACRARGTVDPVRGARLTEHQIRTLSYLDLEDPTMVTELADFIGVTASTMSLNLKRLEAGGYVSRARDPSDRRAMNVRLTEDGQRIVDGHRRFDPERVGAMLLHVRPEDRERALEGIAILARAADASMARGQAQLATLAGEAIP
jgi:DNA-binding MarR family transcriptional regulator